MQIPEVPVNEKLRLRELESYNIIGAAEEDDFDFLTSMAAQICKTKISLISLVTHEKQCFLSHHGLETSESPRDFSFCAHAINHPDQCFVVEDARTDVRFFDNPLTTGKPHVIFYAGMPLVNSNGFPLGTLCVIDDKPARLTDEQLQQLQMLARQTVKLLELRRSQIELGHLNEELEQFAYIAAHDLKEPLRGITASLSILQKKYSEQLDNKAHVYIDHAYKSAKRMKKLITDILDFSNTGKVGQDQIDLNDLMDIVFSTFNQDHAKDPVKLSKSDLPVVTGDASSFIQLFTNLIDNAIKYQPEGNVAEIKVEACEDEATWTFSVADNGIGIAPEYQEKVFEVFKRLHTDTEYSGSGIGLANCKKIVKAMGGKIWYENNQPTGTIFKFTLPK
ncbi:MAG: ATP-binding protein [Cyclobacterium sp.]|uniref:GAF domain-containing sensor histidine kinase n=1 Tax=unclassified Cyclobacterium TaxID=2615055 RepID=UPI0013D313CF|nr:ATP-binding protein [Cyclobacterium sp. SYSU L10401]